MSLEFTENKSSIGSGALNDLVLFMSDSGCRPVGDQSAISRRSDGERSATDWRSVGDCILSVCFWMQKLCNFLEIGRQPIGDWSAISRRLKTVSGLSATGRRSVANQSATCRQPVGDYQKPFYDWSGRREVSLVAEQFSLQPAHPCFKIDHVGSSGKFSYMFPVYMVMISENKKIIWKVVFRILTYFAKIRALFRHFYGRNADIW